MSMAGGRAALGGFLFEILTLWGMEAQVYTELEKNAGSYEGILECFRSGEVQHESLGQDATVSLIGIKGDADLVLLQFKFSQQQNPPKINPKELREIVKKLWESFKKAKKLGYKNPKYVLMSNRKLGPTATKIKNNPATAKDLNKNVKEVLRDLIISETKYLTAYSDSILKFGSKYGLGPEVCETGIERLIGRTLQRTATGQPFALDNTTLVEMLTGSPHAQPLQADSVLKVSSANVRYFKKAHLKEPNPYPPIPRLKLKELSRKLLENAMVIIEGHGGCGKSTLLGQWAERELHAGKSGAFTHVGWARDVSENWIFDIIRNWGNLPSILLSTLQYPNEEAIARLLIANQEFVQTTILHLGLDGFDEVDEITEQGVRKMLRWFYRQDLKSQEFRGAESQPQVVLVVTCRDASKLVEVISDAPLAGVVELATIKVDDFEPEELEPMMSHLKLDSVLEQRLREVFEVPSNQLHDPFSSSTSAISEITSEVGRLLCFPAVWGCFLAQQADDRLAILNGQTQELEKMFSEFMCDFYRKARRRGLNHEDSEFNLIFGTIALESLKKTEANHSRKDWSSWANGTGLIESAYEARRIYDESLSFGIIQKDNEQRWRWRFKSIMEYLAKKQGECYANE